MAVLVKVESLPPGLRIGSQLFVGDALYRVVAMGVEGAEAEAWLYLVDVDTAPVPLGFEVGGFEPTIQETGVA